MGGWQRSGRVAASLRATLPVAGSPPTLRPAPYRVNGKATGGRCQSQTSDTSGRVSAPTVARAVGAGYGMAARVSRSSSAAAAWFPGTVSGKRATIWS
jgi:hypothetical protein